MSDTEKQYEWSADTVPNKVLSIGTIEPKYNLMFHNAEGHVVGTMDFNGPGLAFEGNAEMSAIVFIDWIAKAFESRLKEEYERGFADGKAAE